MDLLGLLYLFLVFAACFAVIAFFKLAALGLKTATKKPEKPVREKSEKQVEPVYYIVEKKRARKCTYSQPKEIKFKEK